MIRVEEFIKNHVVSDSAKKSYATLFKRIEEYEELHKKTVDKWNKEDCIDFLSSIGSKKKYNTVAVKWSLLKKYLFFIDNETYKDIIKTDLENIEDRAIKYIPKERLIKATQIFENYLDQALLLLIRNGIRGEEFSELSQLKTKDIEGNVVTLPSRKVVLDNYTTTIVEKAKEEKGYHMDVKEAEEQGKRIVYSYYGYNNESEYLWKNRPNKFNSQGLASMKANASKVKINSLISKINKYEGNIDISATSLTLSYVVDEILKVEETLNIKFSEVQTKTFISNLGVKCDMYSCYTIKNEVGGVVNELQ